MRRLAVLLLLALPAFGKAIYWNSIDVKARLDADARLHVIERQEMVFTGDWNGGERDFNVIAPQTVTLHSLTRIDNGKPIRLGPGSLEQMDRYAFVSDGVLRWRSRMPGDPEFQFTELTYELDYTYDRIVWDDAGTLLFSHDFGLPKRQGLVTNFTLHLEFDPVWNTPPVQVTRTDLPPGESVAVRRTLPVPPNFWPAGVTRHRPEWTGWVALAIFLAVLAALIASFVRAEAKQGRFQPLEPKFDADLMELRPELLGAIWDAGVDGTDLSDNGVGPSEVAAVLARLTQEGKIESRVEKKNLHMRLLVPRREFAGYERALIDGIFVDGDEMDTKRLKQHYRRASFDPSKAIRPGIHSAIAGAIPGWSARQKRMSHRVHTATLIAVGALLVALAIFGESEDKPELIVTGIAGLIFGVLGCSTAYAKSRAVTGFFRAFLAPAILLAIPMLLVVVGALRAFPGRRLSAIGLVVCAAWLLAIVRLALDLMKMPDTSGNLAVRRRVAALRLYFKQQLRQPQPALRDEWFPYLLAFGLGKHADRWFRAFGGASSGSSSGWSGASSSSSSAASGWTGGGGAFGGAGATGSWAAAAGVIAAGTASGGSGSSGGGSSSGGGGGGGW